MSRIPCWDLLSAAWTDAAVFQIVTDTVSSDVAKYTPEHLLMRWLSSIFAGKQIFGDMRVGIVQCYAHLEQLMDDYFFDNLKRRRNLCL